MLSQRAEVRGWKQVPMGMRAMIPDGLGGRRGRGTGRAGADEPGGAGMTWMSSARSAFGGFFPMRDVTATRSV